MNPMRRTLVAVAASLAVLAAVQTGAQAADAFRAR